MKPEDVKVGMVLVMRNTDNPRYNGSIVRVVRPLEIEDGRVPCVLIDGKMWSWVNRPDAVGMVGVRYLEPVDPGIAALYGIDVEDT